MPAAGLGGPMTIKPVWRAAPYHMINGTAQTTTKTSKAADLPDAIEQTPSVIPTPIYESVSVVPASDLPPSPTHAPVPQYIVSTAKLLQGYCTEPAYTIVDGPTAIWMPVVGCISSKADCCPTSTEDGGAAVPTRAEKSGGGGSNGEGSRSGGVQGGAKFPKSALPSQGFLTGCPQDYHTVDRTACCPSSYWLWSTSLGGQVPCYSTLDAKLNPPPIPDTLVDGGAMMTASTNSLGSPTTTVPALTMTQKPTLAIVNIAYAMQYPLADEAKPALSQPAKIGVGVGSSVAGIFVIALIWFVVRKIVSNRKAKDRLEFARQTSVQERFGSGVRDRSRVAHHGGKPYTGVSSAAINY